MSTNELNKERDINWFKQECYSHGYSYPNENLKEQFAESVAKIWADNGFDEIRARLNAFKQIRKEL